VVARRQVPPQPAGPEATRLVPVPVPRYPTGSGASVTSTASSAPSA
jgi:hypothetical protein